MVVIVYFWNINEGFRNVIIGVWEVIVSVVSIVWNGIVIFFIVIILIVF